MNGVCTYTKSVSRRCGKAAQGSEAESRENTCVQGFVKMYY